MESLYGTRALYHELSGGSSVSTASLRSAIILFPLFHEKRSTTAACRKVFEQPGKYRDCNFAAGFGGVSRLFDGSRGTGGPHNPFDPDGPRPSGFEVAFRGATTVCRHALPLLAHDLIWRP